MRLGIDLDGVVADFNAGWMRRYNAAHGTDLTPDLIDEWNGMLAVTDFAHMGEFWRFARGGDGPSIFRDLPVFEGAVETLQSLSRRHQIVILTTKPTWAIHDTYAWISENRLPTREVHLLTQKWTVDCDVYLDDAPHVLEAYVQHRPDAVICRFVRPWNEPVAGTVDVHDWDAFRDLVERL